MDEQGSLSLRERVPPRSASPTGEASREAAGEGARAERWCILALIRRFAPPSPGGRRTDLATHLTTGGERAPTAPKHPSGREPPRCALACNQNRLRHRFVKLRRA